MKLVWCFFALVAVAGALQVRRTDQSHEPRDPFQWPGMPGFNFFGNQNTAVAAAAVIASSSVPVAKDFAPWANTAENERREKEQEKREAILLAGTSSQKVKALVAKQRFWNRLHREHEERVGHQRARTRLIVDVSANPHSFKLSRTTVLTFISCVIGGLGLIAFMMHFKIFVNS
mmetsp:Transcript_70594/g.132101  ORF Transcript_70594/g.132101 Transcript_70594/m.132101 type:complete len:174 (+) Transcript_70594:113-634(+)